jgi:hypothetical protein
MAANIIVLFLDRNIHTTPQMQLYLAQHMKIVQHLILHLGNAQMQKNVALTPFSTLK